MREPKWWYEPDAGTVVRLLEPVGSLWGRLVRRRFERTPSYKAAVPVICIGNFTAGGAGKTPLSLEVAELVSAMGLRPAFLSRGYGGSIQGPHWVDPARDQSADVGDEPRLLASACPTLICRNRAEGARAITSALSPNGNATDVIIMDDGLQNPQLAKDLTLAVIDGRRGVGNSRTMPAGPLRAPLDFQLSLVDAIVVNRGSDPTPASDDFADKLRRDFEGPVLDAGLSPKGPTDWLTSAPVVAFAGIGVPDRFYATLAALGAGPVAQVSFPDHHEFTAADASRLLALARSHNAILVTTEKDYARLAGGDGPLAELREIARPLPVRMKLEPRDENRLVALIEGAVGRRAPKR
jgi:tetraacyldisaccharide 4'-kinase